MREDRGEDFDKFTVGVAFKNNLRKRVSFKTNYKGDLFCTWVAIDADGKLEPPLVLAG